MIILLPSCQVTKVTKLPGSDHQMTKLPGYQSTKYTKFSRLSGYHVTKVITFFSFWSEGGGTFSCSSAWLVQQASEAVETCRVRKRSQRSRAEAVRAGPLRSVVALHRHEPRYTYHTARVSNRLACHIGLSRSPSITRKYSTWHHEHAILCTRTSNILIIY